MSFQYIIYQIKLYNKLIILSSDFGFRGKNLFVFWERKKHMYAFLDEFECFLINFAKSLEKSFIIYYNIRDF